ncbi:hypothetical protein [Streptomyces sp. NPDC012616]
MQVRIDAEKAVAQAIAARILSSDSSSSLLGQASSTSWSKRTVGSGWA